MIITRKRIYKVQIPNRKMYPGVGTVLSSIEPPCATTLHPYS